jgi:hypothetical protein
MAIGFDSKESVLSPPLCFSLLPSHSFPLITTLPSTFPFRVFLSHYTMDLVSSSSPVGSLLNSVDRQHVYIAGTAFLVFALVAAVLLFSFRKQKVDYNSGIFTYLKFIYASFLKPHEKGEGQQDALESFYKTQVRR